MSKSVLVIVASFSRVLSLSLSFSSSFLRSRLGFCFVCAWASVFVCARSCSFVGSPVSDHRATLGTPAPSFEMLRICCETSCVDRRVECGEIQATLSIAGRTYVWTSECAPEPEKAQAPVIDTYDPRLPQYVTDASPQDILVMTQAMLEEQAAKLSSHTANLLRSSGGRSSVLDHYRLDCVSGAASLSRSTRGAREAKPGVRRSGRRAGILLESISQRTELGERRCLGHHPPLRARSFSSRGSAPARMAPDLRIRPRVAAEPLP